MQNALTQYALQRAVEALDAAEWATGLEWLAAVPADMHPKERVFEAHVFLAREAVARAAWGAANDHIEQALAVRSDPLLQRRLPLVRNAVPLLDDERWAFLKAKVDPALRLPPDHLAPEVSGTYACGAYHAWTDRWMPWSNFLRLAKEARRDTEDGRATLRIASEFMCRVVFEETPLLRLTDVVVAVPANPARYARQRFGASIPARLRPRAAASVCCSKQFSTASGGKVFDPKDLLLTSEDVPTGFKLQGEAQRPLEVGVGKYAEQAHRAFQKRRILNFSDAIWSEATVFPDVDSAVDGIGRLVDYHKVNPGYDDIREIGHQLGDDSFVHTGSMRGKPGLWAAVRTGSVIHRFNTYNVDEALSRALLDRQLAKQAGPAAAISIAEAVQMSYVGFIDAFKTRDMDQVNEWWLRLQLAVQKGRYKELQPLLDAFWDATGRGDQDELKRTMERLSAAVAALK